MLRNDKEEKIYYQYSTVKNLCINGPMKFKPMLLKDNYTEGGQFSP